LFFQPGKGYGVLRGFALLRLHMLGRWVQPLAIVVEFILKLRINATQEPVAFQNKSSLHASV
jgi:hypothetical protein